MTAERPADVAALTEDERREYGSGDEIDVLWFDESTVNRILAARVAAAYAEGYAAGRAESERSDRAGDLGRFVAGMKVAW